MIDENHGAGRYCCTYGGSELKNAAHRASAVGIDP